jgi:hypothetical integral membrane protein (TIGR02206 family)
MPPAFHAFNAQHLVALGLVAFFCIVLVCLARKTSTRCQSWIGRSLAALLVCYAAVLYTQQAMAHSLQWRYSLPLNLCNLTLIACIISLLWPRQLITEIAYFWGLGGALQALLTPDLSRGFPSWSFIFFFWGHGAILRPSHF